MPNKKVFITGANGFIGSRLVRLLESNGFTVATLKTRLQNSIEIEKEIKAAAPFATLVHLAAMSDVPSCEAEPEKAREININGTKNLLEALEKLQLKPHFVFASTAQVYRPPTTKESHMSEEWPIDPPNVHGHTKLACEQMIYEYTQKTKAGATILRIFNHTHKDQSARFFMGHIYSQLKISTPDQICHLEVGNLDLYRDIGSVEDLLKAFLAVIERPTLSSKTRTYNICSGHKKHIKKLAQILADKMQRRVEFHVDPARVRPNEPYIVVGSPEKIRKEIGWDPFCQTEEELVESFLKD